MSHGSGIAELPVVGTSMHTVAEPLGKVVVVGVTVVPLPTGETPADGSLEY